MNQTTVLLISKRAEINTDIKQLLEQDNIRTCPVGRWEQAQTFIVSEQPQLILLDSPGPVVAGLTACREIRTSYQGLLMLLFGDADENLHTLALSMGVDSSLPCDSGLQLITAQIKALLRRFASSEPPAVQTFGRLTIDANKRDVFVADQAAQLSTVEFNLFWSLVKKAGCVVSRSDIHRDLYNSPYNGYDRGIDIYISRIRQKIGDDPITPRYLKTVRGAGYQFVAATD
ncbi:MAG: response regulator transcription factor [Desulfuromusa sp.]|jgi:DNA-binding response OmpR family regulator|nr:response regulator transcription factor [Desulfuromusa sp.]